MSDTLINQKWTLASRPHGMLKLEDLKLVEEPVDISGDVPEGKAYIKVEMLACDAFLRTMLEDGAFHGTVQIGGVVPAFGFGTVIKSAEGGPEVGTRVGGMVMAQSIALVNVGPTGCRPYREIEGMGPEANLGLLGMTTGLTAYVGIMLALQPPKEGDTCVVSAATGAVGNIAAQLCKASGAKVIGVAGGRAKCNWLRDELNLDGAVDYKDKSTSIGEQLDKLCPDGINFFFDNVGGDILDEVLLRITQKARIVVCGGISQYSNDPGTKMRGPANYLKLAERNSKLAGFVVSDYAEHFKEGSQELQRMYKEGTMKVFETKRFGIQQFPGALQGLFTGTTMGKTLVDLTSNVTVNRKWVVAARPQGMMKLEDLRYVEEAVDMDAEVPAGKALIKVEMLACDAFLRTMLEEGAFHGTVKIGGVVPAFGYGVIVKAGEGSPPVGTRVGGMVMAQTMTVVDVGSGGPGTCRPYEEIEGMGPEANLGLLGMTTGVTAYVGIMCRLKPPQEGDVCVVSAATGAVGNIAAQLCKAKGAKVIGVAGGQAKCDWLRDEMKLDGAVDYKDKSTTIGEQLDKLCPDGISFFFDNVGGDILDEVLLRIKQRARVVICGGISQYSNMPGTKLQGPSNYLKLAERNADLSGFVVSDYLSEFKTAKEELQRMHKEGSMKIFETKMSGIDKFPIALQGLFTGTTMGKTLVETLA